MLAFVESNHSDCPRRQLFSFEKVHSLEPSKTQTIVVRFDSLDAMCVNVHGERTRPTGAYSIVIGAEEMLDSLRHEVVVVATAPMPL